MVMFLTGSFGFFWWYFTPYGQQYLVLLTFECGVICMEVGHTLVKILIHKHDLLCEGHWEKRNAYTYLTEFVTETITLLGTLVYYAYIILLHGLSFTVFDVVLLVHTRLVWNKLVKQFQSFANYQKLNELMSEKYKTVKGEDLTDNNDVCAICRDAMEEAKLLPCGHLFHEACLLPWLKHHHNCPTCRKSLIESRGGEQARGAGGGGSGNSSAGAWGAGTASPSIVPGESEPIIGPGVSGADHQPLIRFSSPRFNLFPGFSVSVIRRYGHYPDTVASHPGEEPAHSSSGSIPPIQDVPLSGNAEREADQLGEIFPHIDREVILADLRRTGSREVTTDNILEGRLVG
eukprot:CAMPEP_0119121854 /NCGR_PEP_ID=MMETSP1310-20130426/2287_1 /TAXON_ID=464262 /ORGANISM="Genus nov. species nov., Strain RCC2339" /LENGTH=345 /DNA_ID=CAMNT_0007111435 /DNA_START=467 /DNA_END=1504 /DNA_ORIENTATION=+